MSRTPARSRAGDDPMRGRWIPRVFFWCLFAALAFLGWKEVENRLESPAMVQRRSADKSVLLTFYSRGRADRRETWVFRESPDGSGTPVLLVKLDRAVTPPEALFCWSADGRGLLLFDRAISTRPRIFPFGNLPPGPDAGPLAARVAELGRREPRLRFWQATRWERAISAAD